MFRSTTLQSSMICITCFSNVLFRQYVCLSFPFGHMTDVLSGDEDYFPLMSTGIFFKQQFDRMTNSVNMFSQLIQFSIFLIRNINLVADID